MGDKDRIGRPRALLSAAVLLAVVATAGCNFEVNINTRSDEVDAQAQLAQPATAPAAARLSVERFLLAANQRDLPAMGNLFGTVDGPTMDTGNAVGCAFKRVGSWFGGAPCVTDPEVEARMDLIASILTHQDYRVVREQRVAGLTAPTTRVLVDMTVYGESVSAVPVVVVQTPVGRWLVQEVDLQRVMAGSR